MVERNKNSSISHNIDTTGISEFNLSFDYHKRQPSWGDFTIY